MPAGFKKNEYGLQSILRGLELKHRLVMYILIQITRYFKTYRRLLSVHDTDYVKDISVFNTFCTRMQFT
jgi:hypothetical protein